MIFLPSSVPSKTFFNSFCHVRMSSMDLYSVKSGDLSALCRFNVLFNDTVDFIFRKRTWNLSTCFRRNVRSGYWLHICSLRLSGCSCMVDLDTDTGSVLMNSFCQLEQTWKKSMIDRCLTIYVYNAYYIKE